MCHGKSATSSKTFAKRDSPSPPVPGGKGSHRKFEHPAVKIPAIIPGRDGDDAKIYLERHIAEKINESKS